MDKLLIRYCNLLKISVYDFKGDSHANELPTYRHIFYYCVKTHFSNVKLRHIAETVGKKPSGVGYGIKKIGSKITPITKTGGAKNLVTPEMQVIKNYVASFLDICKEYKEKDLKYFFNLGSEFLFLDSLRVVLLPGSACILKACPVLFRASARCKKPEY